MELTDLKMRPKVNRDIYTSNQAEVKGGYPEGAKIHLDSEMLAKLGIVNPPAIGDRWHVRGFAMVESVKSVEDEGGADDLTVTLQFTHMDLGPVPQHKEADEVFYGKPSPVDVE